MLDDLIEQVCSEIDKVADNVASEMKVFTDTIMNMEENEMFEKFVENITSAGKDVSDRTKNGSEVIKLTYKAAAEQKALDNLYSEIGKKFYETNKKNYEAIEELDPADELGALVKSALEKEKNIEDIRTQVRFLKGVVICQECGAEISSEYDYCGKCGAKLVKPEPPKAEEPAEEEAKEETEETEESISVEVVVADDDVTSEDA